MPDGHTIGLVLSSPILQHRKTKARLAQALREYIFDLSSLHDDRKIEINGNKITVFLNSHGESDIKKISAAFMHRSSNPDILTNVKFILEERIKTKATKCQSIRLRGPVWLALINDYWLTDADTYKYALSQMSLEHPFQKILLVNGDGSVDPLCG